MIFLNYEYFWFLLFLVPFFTLKNFRDFRVSTYGYIFTYILLVLALSRPVFESQPVHSEEILSDIVLGVDLSYSMQATDITPSRLAFAKEKLFKLLNTREKSRFGVIGFTTNAIVLSPLTQDTQLLKHLFNALDEKLIMTKGSSIMPALKLSREMSSSKFPSVVIFSDGGDKESYIAEAKYAKENSLVVNIFIIGTKIGSTLLLENRELLKDENENIVVSRINENISIISKMSGGVYTSDYGVLMSALDTQKNKDFKSKTTTVNNQELFYYFIFLAIVMFLVSVTTLKRHILAFALLFGVNINADILDYFQEKNRVAFKSANYYYKEGEYEKALLSYESVKSSSVAFKSRLYFNMGNTFVRLKEFKKARESYLKSLTLEYSKEADENLAYIKNVEEEMIMNTGQQKTNEHSSTAKKSENSKNKKQGGSSNMKVSANASSGATKSAKKSIAKSMLDLNQGRAKLSSKQYELINKRSLNEKKPY